MLEILQRYELPLREASALAIRQGGPGVANELLAVDDECFDLAVAPVADGVVAPARRVDIRAAMAGEDSGGGSDFEGVASDASRRVFVARERMARIVVLAARLDVIERTIRLSVPNDGSPLAMEWHAEGNARAEGLLLLRSGHILIAKESGPPRLIEFGPAGARPHGFAAGDALAPHETFPLPTGLDSEFQPLASWTVDRTADIASINDLAVDDTGRLHLVSAVSRNLARADSLDPRGGVARLAAWRLPAGMFDRAGDRAEGLVFAPRLGWLVANDLNRRASNLFVIGGVPR